MSKLVNWVINFIGNDDMFDKVIGIILLTLSPIVYHHKKWFSWRFAAELSTAVSGGDYYYFLIRNIVRACGLQCVIMGVVGIAIVVFCTIRSKSNKTEAEVE